MKSDEEIMEILEAFDLTHSFRDAAELAGCDHHTVARLVGRRERGNSSRVHRQDAARIDRVHRPDATPLRRCAHLRADRQ